MHDCGSNIRHEVRPDGGSWKCHVRLEDMHRCNKPAIHAILDIKYNLWEHICSDHVAQRFRDCELTYA